MSAEERIDPAESAAADDGIKDDAGGLNDAPKGMRIHIAFYGRRNVGKSSLINAITRQNTAIVSDIPGTTTDPVEKTMEMLPLGPVLLVDTAGIDDVGVLGQARVERTRKVMESTDIAILAIEPGVWGEFEEDIVSELESRKVPYVIAITKRDVCEPEKSFVDSLPKSASSVVNVSSTTREGIQDLKDALVYAAPEELVEEPQILADLIPEHGLAVLVIPVDKQAPKGRLILPQVQTLRDLLDGHCSALVVQDTELESALGMLGRKPDIVVTDSQAFARVAPVVPEDVPMTGFSLLFARFKGDFPALVHGAGTLDALKPGDRVLIAESCTHHPIQDDIGTVKIPRLLAKSCPDLQIDHCQGTIFPDNLADYRVVIHCGACMLNRKAMRNRIAMCENAGVSITNYGMTIAHALGILPRALQPFEGANEIYEQARREQTEEQGDIF